MKKNYLLKVKARSAFKSLYPFLVKLFDFSDSEIDFFVEHPIFNYRLYVCNCLCEVVYSDKSLFVGSSFDFVFKVCFILLEGNFLPF